MLDRHSKRLLVEWVVGLLTFVAFAPATQANPITVKVTGDIYDYATFHYDLATDIYTYSGSGSTGSLSGTFRWDPALMGPTPLHRPPTATTTISPVPVSGCRPA